ncbi:hypothetical protein H4219_004452 [Mycoemilia scoparia]|uniref:Uncharacterized protein n=1 Tax=Mycoemilia scoparia TaxID=417184 RepID=A0A9W8DR46_9FUNG|nr:hypothetical protein H4219_004452 [Mycoemilia scoparia]
MSTSVRESPIWIPVQAPPELAAGLANLSLGPNSGVDKKYQRLLNIFHRHALNNRRKAIRRPSAQLPGKAPKGSKKAVGKHPKAVAKVESNWEDDIISPAMIDSVLDISDNPDAKSFSQRVAKLFNQSLSIKPPLGEKDIYIERLSGALTNCVYRVTVNMALSSASHSNASSVKGSHTKENGSNSLSKTYLLRVYGIGVDEFLVRNKELYWLRKLSELNIGPSLYSIYTNGRIEEYLFSDTLTKDDIRDPSTSRHIARRMCELHYLVNFYAPHKEKTPEEQKDPLLQGVDLSGKPDLWTNIYQWIDLVATKAPGLRKICGDSPECLDIINDIDKIRKESKQLEHFIEQINSPIVLAHSDLQYGNILRLHKDRELVVVDFEYAGYNYRGFDIANHFCEWMSNYHHPTHPHLLELNRYPTQKERYNFLRTYLKTRIFLDANKPADRVVVESDEVSEQFISNQISCHMVPVHINSKYLDDQLPIIDKEVQSFIAASHLHWGIWGLLQAYSSEIDFDYVGYSAQRLTEFRRLLADIPNTNGNEE